MITEKELIALRIENAGLRHANLQLQSIIIGMDMRSIDLEIKSLNADMASLPPEDKHEQV